MSDYFHEEIVKELEEKFTFLKSCLDDYDDLLEALKTFMLIVPRYTDEPYALVLRRLEEAIARAEGRVT